MEGMGLKFTRLIVRHLLGPYACLGPLLAPLGLIASPNSTNGGFNPSLAAHMPTPPLPPAHPYNVPSVILQWLKVAQNSAVLAS